MLKISMIVSLLLIGFLSPAHALTAKEKIFYRVFQSSQVISNRCADNSVLLLREWKKAGLDVGTAALWEVTGELSDYLGMVKYYQNRWENFIRSKNNPSYFTNGSGGWHYHAFIVDEGRVYDSSYRKEPTVTDLNEYVYDMFVLKEDVGSSDFSQKRSFGLKAIYQYKVVAYPAEPLLQAKEAKQSYARFKQDLGSLGTLTESSGL